MEYKETKGVMNQLVVDLSQFSAVIHQTHWYMRGPRFLSLHPKMDEFRGEIENQLDEIAERLITLGGKPYATLSEILEYTQITEEKSSFDISMDQRLLTLVENYLYIRGLYENGILIASREGDSVTEDIFIGFKGAIEKNIWMIQAELNHSSNL